MRAPLRSWRSLRAAALALIGATVAALPAAAQTFPPLTGRVVDEAHVLDAAARGTLADKLKRLETQTTDQVVVATVPSLQGYSIEDYANRLFRAWGLGQKDKNNGVLLLVAPSERKVRIEVGYGREDTLTDAVAKLIIERTIVPAFRAGDMAGGIARGTDDIVAVLGGDAAAWQQRAASAASNGGGPHVIELSGVAGYVVAAVIIVAGALIFGLMGYIVLFVILGVVVDVLVALHVLPQRKNRRGKWTWLNVVDTSGSHAWASSSSGSSDSFSGGGGSSGGGGASGSW